MVTVIPGPPPPVMSPREVETNVRRLQAELLREETKLALMRRMYQLQNQPPKIEKREEPASGADKKGQLSKLSASNMMQQQNGFKNARGNPDHMMGKGEKQLLRDTKVRHKPCETIFLIEWSKMASFSQLSHRAGRTLLPSEAPWAAEVLRFATFH